MAMVVKVRFRRASKLYDFDTNGLDVSTGTYIVTETIRGIEIGECMSEVSEVSDTQVSVPLKPIHRIATEEDLRIQSENEEKEKTAFEIADKKIQELKLDMKLVDVEYAFDRSKITFNFTADGRVDFRNLVKNLASVFKTRIELRQIGVRDEAKMLGGLGPCGRPICCRQFLTAFQPVSIKMAKEQNLSLNPTKISGICDRLMCCLKYEQDHYETTRKKMPKVGKEIETPEGFGTVTAVNVLSEQLTVRLPVGDSFENRVYTFEEHEENGEVYTTLIPLTPKRDETFLGSTKSGESSSFTYVSEPEPQRQTDAGKSEEGSKSAGKKGHRNSGRRKPRPAEDAEDAETFVKIPKAQEERPRKKHIGGGRNHRRGGDRKKSGDASQAPRE